MSNTFDNASNIILNDTLKKYELVDVRIGSSDRPRKFHLIDTAGGNQPFRTQYDMAIDGTQFVLAAGKGLGTYEFRLLEGPLEHCAGSSALDSQTSFLREYKKLKKAEDRQITVITRAKGSSTQYSVTFKGLINNVQVSAVKGESGERYLIIIVSATGVWS